MMSYKIRIAAMLIAVSCLLDPIKALPQSDPIVLTARQLVALKSNELALQKYSGKVVEVRGAYFARVNAPTGYNTFYLDLTADQVLAIQGVGDLSCALTDDSRSLAADLNPGDPITIRGTVREKVYYGQILGACTIVPNRAGGPGSHRN